MFEKFKIGWLLGRPAFGGESVAWTGVAIFPDAFHLVSSSEELDAVLRGTNLNHLVALVCTSSESLATALSSESASAVVEKIIDLPLALRVASTRGTGERTRTIELLGELAERAGAKLDCKFPGVELLEGRIHDPGRAKVFESILRIVLKDLMRQLHSAGEFRRYFAFELPAHRVLLAQSRFRLHTDVEGVEAETSELTATLRKSRIELIMKHGIDPKSLFISIATRRDFARRYLGLDDIGYSYGDFLELLTERESIDSLARAILDFLQGTTSSRSLLSLSATQPLGGQSSYDPLGTSTGRIIMRSPAVQWLGKKYRKHILPPSNYSLRYLDYSCFEPTILAALSGDPELLAACDADIYECVAKWLGLERLGSREIAKAILLRFLYGQSEEKLAATLSTAARIEPGDARSRLEELRGRLWKAFEFREELAARARSLGFMETKVGNRYLVAERDAYKALSHFLQGTASLIFKRALVGIFGGESPLQLVAPMHDAFLCALPTNDLEHYLEHSVNVMRSAFCEVVGVDLARITVREEF